MDKGVTSVETSSIITKECLQSQQQQQHDQGVDIQVGVTTSDTVINRGKNKRLSLIQFQSKKNLNEPQMYKPTFYSQSFLYKKRSEKSFSQLYVEERDGEGTEEEGEKEEKCQSSNDSAEKPIHQLQNNQFLKVLQKLKLSEAQDHDAQRLSFQSMRISPEILSSKSANIKCKQQRQWQSFIYYWRFWKQIHIREINNSLKSSELELPNIRNTLQSNNTNCSESEIISYKQSNYERIVQCLLCFTQKKDRKPQLSQYLLREIEVIKFIGLSQAKEDQDLGSTPDINYTERKKELVSKMKAQVVDQYEGTDGWAEENDKLNPFTLLQLIAFADFHGQIFMILLEECNDSAKPKCLLLEIGLVFSKEILDQLAANKLSRSIQTMQSAINLVNSLFCAMLFNYVQLCARNFTPESSAQAVYLVIEKARNQPDQLIKYFSKRVATSFLDRDLLMII